MHTGCRVDRGQKSVAEAGGRALREFGELPQTRPLLTVIPDEKEDEPLANQIAWLLRGAGLQTDIAFGGTGKRRFEIAKKNGSRARLVIRRSKSEVGVSDRIGHHVVVNEPDAVDAAEAVFRDVILRVLQDNFEVVSHERPQIGYWVDAVIREKV